MMQNMLHNVKAGTHRQHGPGYETSSANGKTNWLDWARTALLCAIALGAGATALFAVQGAPVQEPGVMSGGPFWELPLAWSGVAVLAALALVARNRRVRGLSIFSFGIATMGLLGYLEPFGVFHDSWRNVGLGQLALSSQHAQVVYSDPYVSGSPGGFVLLGAVRLAFPDTASMLQLYPLLCLLVYCAGIYALALAFADTHLSEQERSHTRANAHYRVRFGQLAVFAFLAVASIFSVRINPAPQTVAFGMLPFFLAALLRSKESIRYRILALALFGLIVLTHPITSLMAAAICGAFFLSDLRLGERARPVVTPNTVALYSCLFVGWLVYIGTWVLESGSGFISRMLSVLNSDQRASVTAEGSYVAWDFLWTHRVAMLGAGLLIAVGLIVIWRTNRAMGMRLAAWFAISAAWLPLMYFGEFADRGPLFASLPAAISIAFLLNRRGKKRSTKVTGVLVGIAMLVTATTGFATSYSNHVGEVITASELEAFHALAGLVPDGKIVYAYVPPFTGDDVEIYMSDRVRAYVLGAADFSYDRILRQSGIIAVSKGMHEAATMRGRTQLAAYTAFLGELDDTSKYELVYSNEFVRAYRAR